MFDEGFDVTNANVKWYPCQSGSEISLVVSIVATDLWDHILDLMTAAASESDERTPNEHITASDQLLLFIHITQNGDVNLPLTAIVLSSAPSPTSHCKRRHTTSSIAAG
jgi:hypothetical protein